ncbi:MAG: energy transducer TonB [Candidatus Omnitrophica bacterium]|nr:energy transducer TonB [Candidatus Omnitrophota bacterium]
MREKNIFAIALTFSLAWHLVGGEAVHIVWPEKIVEHKFPAINFWGSLRDLPGLDAVDIDKSLNPQKKESTVVSTKKPRGDMEFNVLAKEALPVFELSEKKDPVIVLDSAGSADFLVSESIKGELKRSILIKPALPKYPEWAKALGNYFEVELKFLILADGTVGTVKKVTSAGYPELDEIGIRYIRKWKFMPLPEGAKPAEQWGTVKLVFNLK